MTVKTATGEAAPMPKAGATASKGLWSWLNQRLPVDKFLAEQVTEYYAPKNFNVWYYFGSLAGVVLVLQLEKPRPSTRCSSSCGRSTGAG
jgi:hypothetical protein